MSERQWVDGARSGLYVLVENERAISEHYPLGGWSPSMRRKLAALLFATALLTTAACGRVYAQIQKATTGSTS
jgi:hypothetical protein